MSTPPPGGMTDAQFREYMKWVRSNTASGPGPALTGLKDSDLKSAGLATLDFAKNVMRGGSELLGAFQEVSKSGASFSTDILGFGKSAFESRLSLREFSDVIRNNSTSLAAMGGNVTRGAEAFARLSKGFFDDKSSAALRDLGYTSKDLNEILAITAGAQKSAFRDDAESRRKTIESAQELATEMDAIAKLTGKSREEQMEEMKKRRVDGAVEAKLRLMTEGKSATEAKAIRDEYLKMEMAARKRGDEQAFKEFFATGTYLTKSAATTRALIGDQATAYENSIKALEKGDVAKVREEQAKADAAALKNGTDRTLLTLATFDSAAGPAGSAMKKFVEDTDSMYHAVKSVADQNGIILNTQKDYQDALKLALDDIKAAQKGQRRPIDPKTGKPVGEYQDVAASGRGMITMEMASQDLKAAAASAAESLVKPATDELSKLAIAYRENLGYLKILENLTKEAPPETDAQGRPTSSAERHTEGGGTLGTLGRATRDALTGVAQMTVSGVTNLFIDNKKVEGRQEGSAGTTGKIIEDFGQGTLMMLHGKEGVVTEDQMKNLALGFKTEGVVSAVQSMTQSLVSGGGSTVTTRTQTDESKAAEKTLQGIKEQYAADRSSLAAKFKDMMPNASMGERRRAMNASDEGKALDEKYSALMKPLEKAIEDGISYEVTKKQEQLAETKDVIEKELEFVKFRNNSILEAEEDAGEEQLEIKQKTISEDIKKSAELAKSVMGKFVEGLNDEEIEKMLPSGADFEDFYIDIQGRLQSFSNDTVKNIENEMKKSQDLAMFTKDILLSEEDRMRVAKASQGMSDFTTGIPLTEEDRVKVAKSSQDFSGATVEQPSAPTTISAGANLDMIGNMFGTGSQLRARTAEIPRAAAGSQLSAEEQARQARERDEAARAANPNPGEVQRGQRANQVPQATFQKATLDDVVKSLDSLNMLMGQLLSTTNDLGTRQVKATRSLSGNVYNG